MFFAIGYVVGLVLGLMILGFLRERHNEIYPNGEIQCIFWPFYLLGKLLGAIFYGAQNLGEFTSKKIK